MKTRMKVWLKTRDTFTWVNSAAFLAYMILVAPLEGWIIALWTLATCGGLMITAKQRDLSRVEWGS